MKLNKLSHIHLFFFLFTAWVVNPAFGQTSSFTSFLSSKSAPKTSLSSIEISAYKNEIKEIYEVAAGIKPGNESGDIFTGYLPQDLYQDYYGIVDDLYQGGIARLGHVKSFETNYKKLYTLSVPSGVDPKIFWWQQYEAIFNGFFQALNTKPEACAKEGEIATTKQCCSGLTKQYKIDFVAAGSCKNTSATCNEHDECCSGLCRKTDFTKPGRCQSVQQCYRPQVLNQDCSPSGATPYCGEGSCTRVNIDSTGLGQCKTDELSCSNNNECCSGKCSNKKCVANYLCQKCAPNGAKPAPGEKCCSGYLDSTSGKCRVLFMPGVNANQIKTNKNIFQKIFSFLIPSAHAQANGCESGQTLTSAQQQLLSNKSKDCAGLDSTQKTQCERAVADLKASYCKDNDVTLNSSEQSEVDQKRQACVANNPQGSEALKECLEEVTTAENSMREGNTSTGVNNTGTAEDGNRFEQFVSKYKAPTISAKTYSDAKNCYFNSFNDNWKAASNVEKNAELFLRSFEYVYVGRGTQDYWQDGKNGNIFKRANKVAKAFRKNRNRVIERTQEIDKEITCKCIAIWGPEQFPQERQDYFNQNCEAEAKELSQKLATGSQNPQGTGSNVDGTTIKNMNELDGQESTQSKLEKDAARMEEIDKGALALSHEKLLIEFLDLRSQAQMDRFVDNQELEKELEALSEYISGTNFEEVWKDEVKDNSLQKHSPPGDSRLLYKWGYKYLGGLLKLIIMIVIVAAFVFAPMLVAAAIAAGALLAGLLLGAFGGNNAAPSVFDIKVVDGKKYNLFYDWDGFERWYVGPLFDNKSSVNETKCRIYAKASACLKSAYAFKDSDMKYLTSIPSEGHFIIDPKLPPFVPANEISIDKMPIYNKTWVQIMNETVDEGVSYLKNEQKQEYGIGPKTLKKDYLKGSKSNLKDKPMEDAIAKNYFIPFRGQFKAKEFDQRESIVNGATKYARCKELMGNADASCNGQFGVEQGDIGYGYLFETDEEAKEWGEYTYELHYVYSSVSKDTYMGYPLLGMDAYFQAVAYNMKLVGSLAAERSKNYSETADLYQKDWERRKGDYQSLGEGSIGTNSRNIKYNKPFFKAFELLEFSQANDLAEFDSVVDQGRKNGSFNRSELNALAAGREKAVRANSDAKKREAFAKDVSKLPGGDLRLSRQSALANDLQKPVDAILNRNPSGAFKNGIFGEGFNSNNLAPGSVAAVNRDNQNDNKPELPTYNFDNNANGSGLDNSFGGSNYQDYNNYGSSSSNKNGSALNDQGMSTSEAERIVNAYENNDSLSQVEEGDTLFTIVSKAYKRNYDRVLTLRSDLEDKNREVIDEDEGEISKKEREKLKDLLMD
ncbi:MAG: hypothetical protein CME62_04835 [Halobacteriovoraceae bacterium]|nr:hypothetical protein [Halobacteriovoraceae bacterium]|tara:strand:+ start:962 stop:4999 length:4038 start_codon:yes stop_codon:yes gene_type:complete